MRGAWQRAASQNTVKKADLDQERLIHFFESVFFFGERRGQRTKADGPAVVLLNDGEQQAAIDLVEAVCIHFKHGKSCVGRGAIDIARTAHKCACRERGVAGDWQCAAFRASTPAISASAIPVDQGLASLRRSA